MSTVPLPNYRIIPNSGIRKALHEEFPFEVEKKQLSCDGNKLPMYGLFKQDGLVVRKSVSTQYEPHTTEDVVALAEIVSGAFGDTEIHNCELDTYFRGGHYVSVMPSIDLRRSVYGTRDNIFPRVLIQAGYGGTSFSVQMGYWRDCCNNMSMPRLVDGMTLRIRHTTNLRSRMSELQTQFSGLESTWEKFADVISALETKQMRISEFLDSVYGTPSIDASAAAVTRHRNRTEAIWRRMNSERIATGRSLLTNTASAWELYNAVQGYVQHDMKARQEKNNTYLGRVVRADNNRYVRRAEQLLHNLVAYVPNLVA